MEMEIIFPGGKKVDAFYKGFTIKTDQPTYAGGESSAPAPFDLFLASIGTCAGLYVLFFCEKRGIPTDGAKVALKTKKDRHKKMIGTIDIEIQLPQEFPEKYREAIIRSVELCSVTKHMYDPPVIKVYVTAGKGTHGET